MIAPLTSTPIVPAMYPVKTEEAASIASPCTWRRIVISRIGSPPPAIGEAMKNAKSIRTERLHKRALRSSGETVPLGMQYRGLRQSHPNRRP